VRTACIDRHKLDIISVSNDTRYASTDPS